MKIRILIVAITVVLLAALSAAGFYVYQQITKPEAQQGAPVTVGEENSATGGEEEVLKETRLSKEGFEITLPPGWQEANTPPEGILAMAIDAEEDVSSGNFQKLDFRTNLSIKSDDMQKYANFNNLENYVASIKTSLAQIVSGISFIQEEQKTINGNRAILIECLSRQEEADFKTLLVFIEGNDSIIYAISFNTFQGSWESYKGVFEQIAQSFKLKYKIGL